MAIKLYNVNILEEGSGNIIITTDGLGPEHEGALGRKLAQQFPDEWKKISSRVKYPVPFGQITSVPAPENSSFDYIHLASVLNHTSDIPETVMRNTVKDVVKQAIRKAFETKVFNLSSILLKGGWRLPTDLAIMSMLDGYEAMLPASKKITFEIYETDPAKFQRIKDLCDSLGWGV